MNVLQSLVLLICPVRTRHQGISERIKAAYALFPLEGCEFCGLDSSPY